MTTDENRQIGSGHIKNKLAIIAVVLINRRVRSVKVLKYRAEYGNGNVGNSIELGIRELLAVFITLSNGNEVNSRILYCFNDIGNLIGHGILLI